MWIAFFIKKQHEGNWQCFYDRPLAENAVWKECFCENLTVCQEKYSKARPLCLSRFFKTQPEGSNFKVDNTSIWQRSGRTYTGMKILLRDKSNPPRIQKAMCHHCCFMNDRVKAFRQLKFQPKQMTTAQL